MHAARRAEDSYVSLNIYPDGATAKELNIPHTFSNFKHGMKKERRKWIPYGDEHHGFYARCASLPASLPASPPPREAASQCATMRRYISMTTTT